MRFEYLQPATVEEATAMLKMYAGRAKLLAGGTDLIVQMRRRKVSPEYVISIDRIANMDFITFDENTGLNIGALATIRSLKRSNLLRRLFPVISEAAGQLASEAVRSTATLGGNLCNASPSADMAPGLISLSAACRITGPAGTREIPMEDFFSGAGSTALAKDEILCSVVVPPLPARTGAAYLKHVTRGNTGLAIAGVAVRLTLEEDTKAIHDARVVLGAVAPTPMRAQEAEVFLKGKDLSLVDLKEVGHLAAALCCPIDDVRATAQYRREMVAVYTRQAVTKALNRARAS